MEWGGSFPCLAIHEIEQVEHDTRVAAIPPLMVLEPDHDAVVGLEVVGDGVGGLDGGLAHRLVAGGY